MPPDPTRKAKKIFSSLRGSTKFLSWLAVDQSVSIEIKSLLVLRETRE